ncbi:hypothetical protein ElyMa_002967800 [Elysia marginata]|uniref:Uncharacterized protein n=1 Tax=Elysia marginata TaxID=1093978 RepID=A0AAV4I809_9GAST|nr:hypothetical protein ElyMa_002967800 [Elysia marginata]
MSDTIQLDNGHDRTFDFDNDWNSDDTLSETRSIPPERSLEDKETNTFGRQLVTFCKVYDLLILNGRTEGDMKAYLKYPSVYPRYLHNFYACPTPSPRVHDDVSRPLYLSTLSGTYTKASISASDRLHQSRDT